MSADDQPMSNEPSAGQNPAGVDIGQLEAVLDLVNGLFCVYDTKGRIEYTNHKFSVLLGYPEENLRGMNIIDLATDRHKKRVREKIRARIEEGSEGSWDLPIRDRAGRELMVIARTAPWYQQGRIAGEILLVEDITERKQAEAEVRESQRRLADTIESLPDATAVVDMQGRIIYWNRAMVEMTGFPAVEMIGKGDHEYTIPFYGYRRPALLDYIIDPSTDIDKEYSYIKRDGNVWYIEAKTDKLKGQEAFIWARATPLYDTSGQLAGAIETVRDVTERKRAEEDLRKSHERLESIFSGTVNALAAITERRDSYKVGHQHRVAALACAIAGEMGLSSQVIEGIRTAGTLHDIGQLFIPLDILNQTGRLTDIERLFVQTHPTAGYDIVKSIPFEGPIAEIILQHHERLDGSGYPRGLIGEEILLEAKILSVADVVEAMASHRPYRAALGLDQALKEIQKQAGHLYDEGVVKACVRVFEEDKFKLPEGI